MELNKENKAELLYGRLRDRIETMTEGESFPSVRQLMQEYQVSRFTVDPVLRKLREQGHLESV
ncbi:MAG: GntR family transcriptional regulator, partial [Lentisphaerae bacterium]